jgi:hypothetical protein
MAAVDGSKCYNPSGLLLHARQSVTAAGYEERAIIQVRQGNLWDRPAEILHHDRSVKTKDSWVSFFKYPIFNWFPSEMLPGNWMPRCGACFQSDEMVRHRKSHPPRLIYGEHENYLLNAPQKYYCRHCAQISKEEKQIGVVRKYRTKFTWLDTDSQILEQLAVENGDIFEMFPCHLSHRAGIDCNLLKSIVSFATKGIGPGSFSDILERNHRALWDLKEKKWAIFVTRRIAYPILCLESNPQNRDEIANGPRFSLDEMRGTVPSPSWLVKMFCAIVDDKYAEHYLSYHKKSPMNQDQKQAISAAKCDLVFEALEFTPGELSLTNVMRPQPSLVLQHPWPSHGIGMHDPRPVSFGPSSQMRPMKRTHQQLVHATGFMWPYFFGPSQIRHGIWTMPPLPVPSPASLQQKKKRTCKVPGCTNPNNCVGSQQQDRCPSYSNVAAQRRYRKMIR